MFDKKYTYSEGVGTGHSAKITLKKYTGSAIIAIGDAIYHFSNGFLNPIKTNSNISFSLGSDYKTITINNKSGNNYYLSVLSFGIDFTVSIN